MNENARYFVLLNDGSMIVVGISSYSAVSLRLRLRHSLQFTELVIFGPAPCCIFTAPSRGWNRFVLLTLTCIPYYETVELMVNTVLLSASFASKIGYDH